MLLVWLVFVSVFAVVCAGSGMCGKCGDEIYAIIWKGAHGFRANCSIFMHSASPCIVNVPGPVTLRCAERVILTAKVRSPALQPGDFPMSAVAVESASPIRGELLPKSGRLCDPSPCEAWMTAYSVTYLPVNSFTFSAYSCGLS